MTTSDNEWQRFTRNRTTNDKEWYNKWQQVVQRMKANESDFRFQNETIMQCLFENIMQNRTSAEAATEGPL